MNYLESAKDNVLLSDQLFYDEILEQANVERDFMMSCLENNIILEAESPSSEKKGGWLKSIIENIKRIFKKFLENVAALFDDDKKWIAEKLPKLKELNFDGLKVNVLPYWKMDPKLITSTLSDFQKEINAMKHGDARLRNLQDREDVEQSGAFKKFVPKHGTFAEGIKAFFKIGETNEPKPVALEGDALKIICVNQMTRYVNEFNSTLLPSLKNSFNNLTNLLDNVDRELSRSSNVSEAFCVIENAYYSDTELSLCANYGLLCEADNSGKKDDGDKPVLNKVEDTSSDKNNNDDKNDSDTKPTKNANVMYYTYLKHVIQLNQLAVAAAITACEERYRAYMSILRDVVNARG